MDKYKEMKTKYSIIANSFGELYEVELICFYLYKDVLNFEEETEETFNIL